MIGSYAYISTAVTTVVKAGPAILLKVVITETAAGTITIYDHPSAASGNIVAVFKTSVVEGAYELNVACRLGIVVVTAAASKVTVVYE